MTDRNIFKAQDVTGDIEEQVTGGCYAVPAGAFAVIFLIVSIVYSTF